MASRLDFGRIVIATDCQNLQIAITSSGFGRIVIATDCQNLQIAITSSDYDLSELGALFREAKFLLRTEFIEQQYLCTSCV
jgi:predicted enzyme related to lactoylglutathione lyase